MSVFLHMWGHTSAWPFPPRSLSLFHAHTSTTTTTTTNHNKPGALSLVAPAAEAHGFAGATGLKAWIPLAYLMHEHAMHAQLSAERRQRHRKAVHGGVHMFRYARPGWTFHGKGLWMLPSPKGMRAAEAPLSLTVVRSCSLSCVCVLRVIRGPVTCLPLYMNPTLFKSNHSINTNTNAKRTRVCAQAGSSNYGFRSFERDLESQVRTPFGTYHY